MTRTSVPTLAHIGIPGPAPFIATGVFLVGIGACFGVYWSSRHLDRRLRKVGQIGFGSVAAGCLLLVTFFPLILGARPSLSRPSTTAQLVIVSPRPGETFEGDPATIPVELELTGGQVVPTTSLHLVPNEGHIHLAVDGALASMTGLRGSVTASPGTHTLTAEFVAIDHGPFSPRVLETVTFTVSSSP